MRKWTVTALFLLTAMLFAPLAMPAALAQAPAAEATITAPTDATATTAAAPVDATTTETGAAAVAPAAPQSAPADPSPAPGQIQNTPAPALPQVDSVRGMVVSVLMKLGSALAILVIGYLIAQMLASAARVIVEKSGINKRISAALGEEDKGGFNAARTARTITFWTVMLITLVAFFDALGLPAITQPLNAFLGTVFAFAPRLIAAGIIFLVAIVLATVARWAVQTGLNSTTVDRWLLDKAGVQRPDDGAHAKTLGNLAYGLVFLLFIPAILDALHMNGLLGPTQQLVSKAVLIIPNFFGAAIILAVGWFVARVVKQVVTTLLETSGIDTVGRRAGFGLDATGQPLSSLGGVLVYALILIPVVIASLQALQIDAVAVPATNMLNLLLSAVPRLFGASLILFVSYLVARLIADLVSSLLAGAGFNNIMVRLGLGSVTTQSGRMPSDAVGYVILVGILLFAAIEAANLLGFGIVAGLIAQFVTFAGKVALAVVVLGIGLYMANVAQNVIKGAGGATAPLSAQVARIAIIVFAAAMALRQTGIAEDIVNTAFTLILGAVAIAFALAFGLGCRDLAANGTAQVLSKLKSDLQK